MKRDNPLFEYLKQGLNEAIAYEKGQGPAKVTRYMKDTVSTVPDEGRLNEGSEEINEKNIYDE